jgi:hypothetical protein
VNDADIAAAYGDLTIEEAASIIAATTDFDAPALRRVGVAIRVPRWRRWWMRLMPKRGRLWLQRETLRQIDALDH